MKTNEEDVLEGVLHALLKITPPDQRVVIGLDSLVKTLHVIDHPTATREMVDDHFTNWYVGLEPASEMEKHSHLIFNTRPAVFGLPWR